MIPLPTTVALEPRHAGKRIEKVLLRELAGIKESFLLMLIHRGKVLLDGRPLERGERVPGAGTVEVRPPDPRPDGPVPNETIPLEVRHEDEDVLVVRKPSGVAMHPGPQHGANTLQNALVARYPELTLLGSARSYGLVSRLDLEVSGLVVVARSVRAHEALVAAFTERAVEKRYRAICLGSPPSPSGVVETPVDERPARTEWRLVRRAGKGDTLLALLALHPVTGRKHQLRIHMAGIGCPILGDRQHGPGTLALARRLGLERLALHAESLAFRHPVSGVELTFETPWPPGLERVWQRAREGKTRGP